MNNEPFKMMHTKKGREEKVCVQTPVRVFGTGYETYGRWEFCWLWSEKNRERKGKEKGQTIPQKVKPYIYYIYY